MSKDDARSGRSVRDGPSLSQAELMELEVQVCLARAIERASAEGEWEVVKMLTGLF